MYHAEYHENTMPLDGEIKTNSDVINFPVFSKVDSELYTPFVIYIMGKKTHLEKRIVR